MGKWFASLILFAGSLPGAALATNSDLASPEFVIRMRAFPQQEAAAGIRGIGAQLLHRAQAEPFLVVASVIFLLAILHTFAAVPITKLAHRVAHDHEARLRKEAAAQGTSVHAGDIVSFRATLLHFLGEVEAIFGIWVVVLLGAMAVTHGLDAIKGYLMLHVNFTEPMFVVVIMALASTRPVLRFAERCLRIFARLGGETPAAWWLSILIVAPMLGSLITEPGAMTIAAMLLGRKLYPLKPSPRLAYATLGLLFVNISIGGVLTNFAAPPVLMVARVWNLSTPEMLVHFGGKAVVGILLSTLLFFAVFRRELRALRPIHGPDDDESLRPIPLFVTLTHLAFMGWTVVFAHYPPLFIGGFLFFLAFSQATAHHQHEINLRGPILVGFFLTGLVIHGGLQGWWLGPILSSLGEWPLFAGAVILTSFNDNAAITFLASQVEGLGPALKYAVIAGAVAGGGLTVIANAPNPAGQSLLNRFFGEGISPFKLAAAALVPTLIASLCLMLPPRTNLEAVFAERGAATVPLAMED